MQKAGTGGRGRGGDAPLQRCVPAVNVWVQVYMMCLRSMWSPVCIRRSICLCIYLLVLLYMRIHQDRGNIQHWMYNQRGGERDQQTPYVDMPAQYITGLSAMFCTNPEVVQEVSRRLSFHHVKISVTPRSGLWQSSTGSKPFHNRLLSSNAPHRQRRWSFVLLFMSLRLCINTEVLGQPATRIHKHSQSQSPMRMCECVFAHMDGWTDGRTDGWMDGHVSAAHLSPGSAGLRQRCVEQLGFKFMMN